MIALVGRTEWVAIYSCTSKLSGLSTQLTWVLPDSGLIGLSQLHGEGRPQARLGGRRGREGALEMTGRAWQEDGTLSSRYWSEAAKETKDPASIFYAWKGERPRHPNAPAIYGTAEIRLAV